VKAAKVLVGQAKARLLPDPIDDAGTVSHLLKIDDGDTLRTIDEALRGIAGHQSAVAPGGIAVSTTGTLLSSSDIELHREHAAPAPSGD
jgi:hypothetical protein